MITIVIRSNDTSDNQHIMTSSDNNSGDSDSGKKKNNQKKKTNKHDNVTITITHTLNSIFDQRA